MSVKFPKWGFWVVGRDRLNCTWTRHLFLTQTSTACGYAPDRELVLNSYFIRFSETPKLDGTLEILFEMKKKRGINADDFPKCKRCLKRQERLQ